MMKKLLTFLFIIGLAIPTIVGATLWEYYFERGQNLPSIEERSNVAELFGLNDYSGTASQNEALETYLRGNIGAGNPITATDWTLSQRFVTTDTTMYLTSVNDIRGNAVTTSTLPAKIYFMVEAENIDNAEIIVCPRSGFDQQNKSFASCTRGLDFRGGSETSVTANKKDHSSGASANMTNVGQFFNLFGGIYDNNEWAKENAFGTSTDSTTAYIRLGTTTAITTRLENQNGVLFYCNNAASCAAIGGGANTYSFVRPLITSGSEVKFASSTYWFTLMDNLFANATSSISSGTASGTGLDDFFNRRANATTTQPNLTVSHNFITDKATSTRLVVGTDRQPLSGASTTAGLWVSGNATTTGSMDIANLCFSGANCRANFGIFSFRDQTATTTATSDNNNIATSTIPGGLIVAGDVIEIEASGNASLAQSEIYITNGVLISGQPTVYNAAGIAQVWKISCSLTPAASLEGLEAVCSRTAHSVDATSVSVYNEFTAFVRVNSASTWRVIFNSDNGTPLNSMIVKIIKK